MRNSGVQTHLRTITNTFIHLKKTVPQKRRYDLRVSCPFVRDYLASDYRRSALAIDRQSGPRVIVGLPESSLRVMADYDRRIQLPGQARPV